MANKVKEKAALQAQAQALKGPDGNIPEKRKGGACVGAVFFFLLLAALT